MASYWSMVLMLGVSDAPWVKAGGTIGTENRFFVDSPQSSISFVCFGLLIIDSSLGGGKNWIGAGLLNIFMSLNTALAVNFMTILGSRKFHSHSILTVNAYNSSLRTRNMFIVQKSNMLKIQNHSKSKKLKLTSEIYFSGLSQIRHIHNPFSFLLLNPLLGGGHVAGVVGKPATELDDGERDLSASASSKHDLFELLV